MFKWKSAKSIIACSLSREESFHKIIICDFETYDEQMSIGQVINTNSTRSISYQKTMIDIVQQIDLDYVCFASVELVAHDLEFRCAAI